MRIEHLALWTRDLEAMRAFYMRWFGARSTDRYASARRAGFASYFLAFPDGGARLELMTLPVLGNAAAPGERVGHAHLAISVGDEA
jgi:lactoylglutathione lyase